jgi:hypothetical protein
MIARRPLLERPFVQNVLLVVALAISVFMLAPPVSPVLTGTRSISFLRRPHTPSVQSLAADPLTEPITPVPRHKPVDAKGIAMTGYTVGGPRFSDLIGLIDRTELNAAVIDVKDEKGELSWVPRSRQAQLAGAGRPKILDPAATVRRLHRHHIYVIGRICTFQDPILANVRPDLAIQDSHGGIWHNSRGVAWLDPYSTEAQDYNIALAVEAISLGFDEIQFDYVRFPTDGDTTRMWFRYKDERLPNQVIADFLARARAQIVPRGAYLSTDLFGLTALVSDDLGIGQKLELIARQVDYVSLMLYPSHFNKPQYGLADPEKEPYKIVQDSLRDAKRRIAGTHAKLRPWLQDFSLRVPYTPVEVRAQIQAAEDLGVNQWLLWNATNRYSEDALAVPKNIKQPPPAESDTTLQP